MRPVTPDIYTHGHHDAVLRSHRWRTAENSAAYLLPHLVNGQRILDVGCGPGTLTTDLARQVAPGEVVGIDVAESVVTEAVAHAADVGVGNARFVSGDFRAAGFEPDSFDVVHAHQVLQHLSDPVGALASMAALTRPGGIVAARDADYGAFTWAPASAGLDRWLDIYLAVTGHNGADATAGRRLLTWAHAAGLADAVYSTSTWTYATPDDRQWWAELWAERTVASSFGRQAVEYGVATEGDLAGVADAWRAWAAHPDAVFMVPHGEIIARPG
jgi:2-polyprenyl-3-methyl-5-hydroxy-6-metoxy-1,4-benzoquinol methylase